MTDPLVFAVAAVCASVAALAVWGLIRSYRAERLDDEARGRYWRQVRYDNQLSRKPPKETLQNNPDPK